MEKLRAAVVIDYQNVHLTAADLFRPAQPRHLSLVHPLHFANQWVSARNAKQREGQRAAELVRVNVYRGLPSPDHDSDAYARNLAQRAEWMKDIRVVVTHRPLKYRYDYDADGRKICDVHGVPIPKGTPVEKGIDVLCALAMVRETLASDVDLVALASQDTDLEPALDEAHDLRRAKIETVSWYHPKVRYTRELRAAPPRRLWNTRLGELAFERALDLNEY